MSYKGENPNSSTVQIWNGTDWVALNNLRFQDSGANTILTNTGGSITISAVVGPLVATTAGAATLASTADAATVSGATGANLSATAGPVAITGQTNVTNVATTGSNTVNGQTGVFLNSAAGDINLSAPAVGGDITLSAGATTSVTAGTNITLTATAGTFQATSAGSAVLASTTSSLTLNGNTGVGINSATGNIDLTSTLGFATMNGAAGITLSSGANVVVSANSGNGDLTVSARNTILSGNLIVNGTTTSVNTTVALVKDPYVNLGQGNTTAGARPGGLVVDYLPVAPLATAVSGAFTATTMTVAGLGAAVGDYVMVTGSSTQENNGLFQVLTYVDPLLTIATGTADAWVQNSLTVGAASGTVTKMTISVIRAGSDGLWEYANGASSPLTFSDFAVGTFGKPDVVVNASADPAPSSATLEANNITYACDVSGGAFSVTIPSGCATGTKVTIKDRYTGGTQAGTNNITIARSGGDTIDGATSQFVATNLGSVTLIKGTSTDWLMV